MKQSESIANELAKKLAAKLAKYQIDCTYGINRVTGEFMINVYDADCNYADLIIIDNKILLLQWMILKDSNSILADQEFIEGLEGLVQNESS